MRNRLFWKLGLSYLLLPLLALAAVDFFAVRMLHHDYERAGFDHLASLMDLAEGQLRTVPADPPALQAWAAAFAGSGARVTLMAQDGAVLVDSARDPAALENHAARPEVREALRRGEGRAIRFSDSVNRDLLYLARPLVLSRGTVLLRMALPLRQVQQPLGEIRMRLLSISLVILLLAAASSLLLSHPLSSRIADLKQFARRVADGDFSPVAVARSGDELTELARALNETAARLEQTYRSLTAERNQSAAILGSMVEGVAVIGAEQRVVFVNDAFCRDLSLARDACIGRRLVEVMRQPELLKLVEAAQAGASLTAAEMTLSAGPVTRHVSVTAAPVRAEGGGAIVLVLHDISELQRLERIRRDFVANVSHEFKTPLTAIQGFTETLLGGALDDAANRRRFLEIIREHARRLARLTDDLLTLSRVEAGKLELQVTAVDVAELVNGCVETTRLQAEQKELRLTAELPADLPALRGDAGRLAEILQNLLDNAVQYTPAGGRITISAAAEGGTVRLQVTDSGIGIPQHEQQRIFERFYRVDAARSREAGGTGLGLSIARHLAEAHGGRIEVRSEAGAGSTFTLFVPTGGDS
jgi:two-component system phosphate regulon sensor histidine kinase PhoR